MALRELFFEDPFWLYVILALVELGSLVVWWRSYEGKGKRWLVLPLVLAGLIFGVESWVETDREKIQQAVHQIARDAGAGRFEFLEERMAEEFRGDFQGSEIQMEEGLDLAKRFSREQGLTHVEVRDVDVKVEGKRAFTVVVTRMNLRSLGPRATLLLRWEVDWVKVGGRWKVVFTSTPRIGM